MRDLASIVSVGKNRSCRCPALHRLQVRNISYRHLYRLLSWRLLLFNSKTKNLITRPKVIPICQSLRATVRLDFEISILCPVYCFRVRRRIFFYVFLELQRLTHVWFNLADYHTFRLALFWERTKPTQPQGIMRWWSKTRKSQSLSS